MADAAGLSPAFFGSAGSSPVRPICTEYVGQGRYAIPLVEITGVCQEILQSKENVFGRNTDKSQMKKDEELVAVAACEILMSSNFII